MRKFKNAIYNLIRDDDDNDVYGNIFDGVIIFLIVVNVVLVIADTFALPAELRAVSGIIETASVVIFTVES